MEYSKIMTELKCELVNKNETISIPKIVGENLHEWCSNEGIEDSKCNELKDEKPFNDCLFNIFEEEINSTDITEIEEKILEKTKTYIQLKNFDKEIMDITNERDIELLQEINKTKGQELIYLIMLLIIAWCFGIYLMFNYLVIEK